MRYIQRGCRENTDFRGYRFSGLAVNVPVVGREITKRRRKRLNRDVALLVNETADVYRPALAGPGLAAVA
jgi:hypothetical protein